MELLGRSRRPGFQDHSGQAAQVVTPVLGPEGAADRPSRCAPEVRKWGVTRLALFGSVLGGQAHADSDADLLIECAPGAKSYDRFLALFDLLEWRLGRPAALAAVEAFASDETLRRALVRSRKIHRRRREEGPCGLSCGARARRAVRAGRRARQADPR